MNNQIDAITKEDGSEFLQVVEEGATLLDMVSNLRNSSTRGLQLGDDKRRNLTFDRDGNPFVMVDPLEIEAQNSLLIEHDERFHIDLPGHRTIMPNNKLNNNEDVDVGRRDEARNCDIPSTQSGEQSTQHSNGMNTDEYSSSCRLRASTLDPSLAGKVDLRDEDDLVEIAIEKPPKLFRHRRAFFNTGGKSHLWPDGKYVYVFDNKIDPSSKSLLLRAFKEIGRKVPCVKFIPADERSDQYIIHTSHNTAQCSTDTVGYMPGIQALVNIGSYCDYALVTHEVFHVLGAIHTHSRPDRDNFVQINWENIDPVYVHNFKKKKGTISISDNEYDYKSAMHYPANAFNFRDSSDPSIRALDKRVKLKDYGHYELDEQDYESLRSWYGCSRSNFSQDENKTEIEESSNHSSFGELSWNSDCIVGPWSEWSECENHVKRRQRFIEIPKNSTVRSCPDRIKQIRCRPKRRTSRSTGSKLASIPETSVEMNFDEDSGKAVAHLKKTVSVVEGQPIVLAVGNPRKFPVKWYQVKGGSDHELSSTDYNIYRTAAGNNGLTIDESSVKENDGQLFLAKILMRNSILRVAFSIEVFDEDEHFSNATINRERIEL